MADDPAPDAAKRDNKSKAPPAKADDKPKMATYVMDRLVYHTPGKPPHPIGSEQEYEPEEVAHLVRVGHMHLKGDAAAPVAANPGGITGPNTPTTLGPAPPNAPLTRSAS